MSYAPTIGNVSRPEIHLRQNVKETLPLICGQRTHTC
jgi:hypothetical protein